MFELPALPYAYNALDPHIDEQTMHLHHDKHHAAYVKNLNDALAGHEDLLGMPIEELLKNLQAVPENISMKVRNNGGGHANHTLFWTIMSPNGGGEPTGRLKEQIETDFSSFTSFKEQWSKAAIGRFGSGWVWLIKKGTKLAIVDSPNQDTPLMEGNMPILGLDVWEHAYYLKYQNRRPEYIEAWWNVVDWNAVFKRYQGSIQE